MRWGVGVEKAYDVGESGFSFSTVIPVVFGDSGEAMMGAGIVCLFDGGLGEYSYCPRSSREGDAWGKMKPSVVRVRVGVSYEGRVGEGVGKSDRVLSASGRLSAETPSAVLARSSHFPRTALISKLPPTRCVGVHLLVALGAGLGELGPPVLLPVGVDKSVLRDA